MVLDEPDEHLNSLFFLLYQRDDGDYLLTDEVLNGVVNIEKHFKGAKSTNLWSTKVNSTTSLSELATIHEERSSTTASTSNPLKRRDREDDAVDECMK